MAALGFDVTLFTSSTEKWTQDISVQDCFGQTFSGHMSRISSDPAIAADCDLLYLCLPGNVIKSKLLSLKPYLDNGVPVASVFSADGFFFIAEEVLGPHWPVMGFQRVPFICRTREPYRVGGITGYRKEILLAHRNVESAEIWRLFFERAFGTHTRLLANFYEAALANSNPIIHPARLMSLRLQIDRDGPFKRMPLFYEEWDDVASDYAIRLDSELRAVAAVKGAYIQPFLEYYDSTDAISLTRKIRSIAAFKGITSPVLSSGNLDYHSRYIQADILISTKFMAQMSREMGLPSPCADEILACDWTYV